MCRERNIPLINLDKIHNKDYLIKKLTEKNRDRKVESIQKDKVPLVTSSSDLKDKTIRELISMCRERNIPLKSYKKSFLIEKLENYNNPKRSSSTSVKEKEIISSSTSSSTKEDKYKDSKYHEKTVRELISLCRERKIPLKSYKKDFLVQKLEKDDKK
jgi:predicted HTH domain antitoxin